MAFKIRQVGWVLPMMMGVAAVGTVFAFAASHSLAGEDRSDDRGQTRAARCVSTPLETSQVIDRHTLYVEDRQGNAAVITMSRDCLWKGDPVMFEFHGGQQICRPIDVELTAGIDTAVPVRCMASDVKLMTRAEAKAFRDEQRGR